MTTPSIRHFGIRHHGPGSARSLTRALEQWQPDALLIEGPADGQDALAIAAHPDMKPPVALLFYVPDDPKQAAYFPEAVFSPEWQALKYGLGNEIPIRLMDLPQAHTFALHQELHQELEAQTNSETAAGQPIEAPEPAAPTVPPDTEWQQIRQDPLSWLARAAGYSDGESWWEHLIEQRTDGTDVFAGIAEAMAALRAEVDALQPPAATNSSAATIATAAEAWHDRREALREAYMRQTIRRAIEDGFERIAVICGAWHAPVLEDLKGRAKGDRGLLKGLPKVKVSATWVPWTYQRLTRASGYGAGIHSPGWYHHLWSHPHKVAIRWLARVARLLRQQDLDASSASIIEAVRLAEALAALRDRPRPGLEELTEAARTVLCFGDALPLDLVREKLLVSDRLGCVPEETPTIPLQQDLQRQQKSLRLKPDPAAKELVLDLRKPIDSGRSLLLHRLQLLDLPWGKPQSTTGTGTFKEGWQLQWHPEFAVTLIEAGVWGNTIAAAAAARTRDLADRADLPTLTQLLERVLLADLPAATRHVTNRLEAEAAVASDISLLMAALPSLANVVRYGDVRNTDTAVVLGVIDGLVTRICIGLPQACSSLDDAAAETLYERVLAVNSALKLLQNDAHWQRWLQAIERLLHRKGLHGLLAGRCCRLLLDAGRLDVEATARELSFALSRASEPAQAAAWIEGLLKGSGLLLVHDRDLQAILDGWVASLPAEEFAAVLPLLRRTFSTFSAPERRQIGESLSQPDSSRTEGMARSRAAAEEEFSKDADLVLPLIAQLLGVSPAP